MTALTLFDLYRAPLTVWVEDPLTHSVLTALWRDPQITVVVTQGKPAVRYLVRSAPARYKDRVFGLVDRDFDDDNEAEWANPGCRVIYTPAHEMENLLLDFDVLAMLSRGQSAEQIRATAHQRAESLCWWMVYKAILRDMQHDLGRSFPGDVSEGALLRSASDVERQLEAVPYWADHKGALERWSDSIQRGERIQRWGEQFQADLAGPSWMQTFSGKELFRHLRALIPGLDEAPPRPPQPSKAERDLNLGKRIAREMNRTGRAPAKLIALRQILRDKAGL